MSNTLIKISFNPDKGLYAKTIGKHRGDDGVLRPRTFWLGSDQIKDNNLRRFEALRNQGLFRCPYRICIEFQVDFP